MRRAVQVEVAERRASRDEGADSQSPSGRWSLDKAKGRSGSKDAR